MENAEILVCKTGRFMQITLKGIVNDTRADRSCYQT
jgi:hypothetical protein